MAMLDRHWLANLATEHNLEWKFGCGPPTYQSRSGLVGFPEFIDAEMVWTAAAFQDQPSLYRIDLNEQHVQELEAAAAEVEAERLLIEQICPQTFRLPTLGPLLGRSAKQIATGRGFFALRGLEPARYSNFKNVVLYVGIASYIGNRYGRQDEYGNMLVHLTDLGASAAPDNERQAPYSSVSQPFHTDTGSILGLYAVGKAEYGGESKLVSSWHVYNQLRRIRPDLVDALSDGNWVFDSFGQNPPYKTRPLIHLEAGRVVFSFSRRPLLGSATSPRSKDIPDLSDKQVEALNMIQLLADHHALVLDLEAGDMLFWNNLGLLHARNGFTDSASHRRHLVRIWLHNDTLAWAIPPKIRQPWDEAFGDDSKQLTWPLEPITDRAYISTQQRASGHG